MSCSWTCRSLSAAAARAVANVDVEECNEVWDSGRSWLGFWAWARGRARGWMGGGRMGKVVDSVARYTNQHN